MLPLSYLHFLSPIFQSLKMTSKFAIAGLIAIFAVRGLEYKKENVCFYVVQALRLLFSRPKSKSLGSILTNLKSNLP